jgi:hypothetical protein
VVEDLTVEWSIHGRSSVVGEDVPFFELGLIIVFVGLDGGGLCGRERGRGGRGIVVKGGVESVMRGVDRSC